MGESRHLIIAWMCHALRGFAIFRSLSQSFSMTSRLHSLFSVSTLSWPDQFHLVSCTTFHILIIIILCLWWPFITTFINILSLSICVHFLPVTTEYPQRCTLCVYPYLAHNTMIDIHLFAGRRNDMTSVKTINPSIQEWAQRACHRCLICLGDICK